MIVLKGVHQQTLPARLDVKEAGLIVSQTVPATSIVRKDAPTVQIQSATKVKTI